MRSWLPPSGGRTRPGGSLRPPQFSIDLPPDPDRQTRQRLDVGPRRPEIDDARAQDVAAVDDRVRDERLAAALQAVEQPAVQRVEVLLGFLLADLRSQIGRNVAERGDAQPLREQLQ